MKAVSDEKVDLVAFEKEKIKGAVRTDFILSAEIIVITLGAVATAPFAQQVAVLVGISLIMTLGVYGLVGGIVKLDDAGLHLSRSGSSATQAFGRGLLAFAPWLMKALSVLGTAAMFLVGGGILLHGVPALGHAVEHWAGGPGCHRRRGQQPGRRCFRPHCRHRLRADVQRIQQAARPVRTLNEQGQALTCVKASTTRLAQTDIQIVSVLKTGFGAHQPERSRHEHRR